MRRLCLFSGGFAAAAAAYLWLLHGAPWAMLAAAAGLCALLFALRTKLTRRAAICLLGFLAGLGWCRGYEALRLRPLEQGRYKADNWRSAAGPPTICRRSRPKGRKNFS